MDSKSTKGRVVFNNIDINNFTGMDNPTEIINKAFLEKEEIIRGKEEKIEETSEEKIPKYTAPRKKKRKIKKSVKITFAFMLVITILITTIISYKKNYIDNPKVIVKNSLQSLEKEIVELIPFPKENILSKNDYSLEYNLSANLESAITEDFENNKLIDYYHLLNNINHGKTTFLLQQDLSNKKFYYNQITKIDEQVMIDDKYFIENSTKYYFVKDFLDKYINAGNNNYFETISEDKTMYDNMEYLYHFILSSIFKNLDDKDIHINWVNTYLEDEPQKLKRVSIELNNAKINKIIHKVLKDLKEDKNSSNILNGIYDGFDSLKIPKDVAFLNDIESISIHFYTKGIKNKIKKYEFSYHSKNSYGISYEIDKKKINFLFNNNPQYNIQYTKEDNLLKGIIQNKDKTEIGSFEFKKQHMKHHFSFHLKNGEYDIFVESDDKQKKERKDSSQSTIKISINNKEKSILSGTMDIEFIQHDKVFIQEQIKDIIFESEISESQKEELKSLLKNRWKEKMIS